MSIFDTEKKVKIGAREFVEQHIRPVIKEEIDSLLKTEIIQEIQKQLGFYELTIYGFMEVPPRSGGMVAPRFSVAERIEAMAEHFGLEFQKTPAEPARVIATKPAKKRAHKSQGSEPEVVTVKKKSMKARLG